MGLVRMLAKNNRMKISSDYGLPVENLAYVNEDGEENQNSTIFVQETDNPNRTWNGINKEEDSLYVAGVWDFDKHSKNNPPTTYAYYADDLVLMADLYLDNIQKPEELERNIQKFEWLVRNYRRKLKRSLK